MSIKMPNVNGEFIKDAPYIHIQNIHTLYKNKLRTYIYEDINT